MASRGMTQVDLARATRLSKSHISLLMSGKRGFTERSLAMMAVALGVPFDLLSLLAMDHQEVLHRPPLGHSAQELLLYLVSGKGDS